MSDAGDFDADDLGSYVMIRHRIATGATDVVGELEAVTPDVLVIRRRDNVLVDVPRQSVLAARGVGPSPLAARTLEGIAARGWPAPDTDWLGQWMLRAAGGFTARANSVRPLGRSGLPLDDALAGVARWYAERDLPAQIQVVVKSSLDAELTRLGWAAAPEVQVMTVPLVQALPRLPEPGASDRNMLLSTSPTPGWLGRFRGGDAGPAAISVLSGGPQLSFAEVPDTAGGLVIAIGRSAREDAWVGITAVEVAPGHRRLGLARSIMRALLEQAQAGGARQAYLEVLATNEPALRLYESMRFRSHHRYRCRSAPRAGGSTPC